MHYSYSSTARDIDTTSDFDTETAIPDWRGRDVALALLVGGVLGAALFFLLLPPAVLDPKNFQWLMQGDLMQAFVGWHFFRGEPWMLPPGASGYGMEMGSSIVFTDSIPLFALLFKLFAAWLPSTFQYFGIWVLTCFVLQGAFAWLLARCITTHGIAQLLLALLLTASTVMTLKVVGHYALVGHWLMLAALLLYLRPPAATVFAWCALIGAAALVHAYLLYLVLAVWAASVLRRYEWADVRKALSEMAVVVLSMLAVMWLAGYFTVPLGSFSGGTSYYGMYAANLNAFWNPGWGSRFLPPLPATPESAFEGYAYLGAGGLLLVAMAPLFLIFSKAARANARQHWPLMLVVLALWAMAVSTHVMLDDRVVLEVTLPKFALKMLEMVRASGRLLWVPYYALLLGSAALLLQHTRPWIGTTLLLGIVVLQGADLSPRALELRKALHENITAQTSTWKSALTSPFWEEAAQRYRTVRFVPARPAAAGYGDFTLYAANHKMAINVGQFARIANSRIGKMNAVQNEKLANGNPETGSLYVFWKSTEEGPFPVRVGRQDRVEIIDGFQILAPDWYGSSGNAQIQWSDDRRNRDVLLP
ncbi:MAG: DUF6311 domain-containing protein [Proteobacteria bacterium]|nr:DUF6311 domain-containing protein [Pseudomonadota bacterium]MCL2307975.1 DUF6311 domain-containing protein [Pseudomonadota bacterium]